MLVPLQPGARIGVFSPSSMYNADRLAQGLAVVRGWGWEPVMAPNVGRPHRYLAGTDAQRLSDLQWALSDLDLDAAWMVRGGYGLARIVPRVDWSSVARGRPVVGFSDGTALHAGLDRQGLHGVHGPVLHSLCGPSDPASQVRIHAVLQGELADRWTGQALIPGDATGPVVGGNLCMLASLAGTGLQVDVRGRILVIEDLAEPPYKIDRLITQLIQAGGFDGVQAVVLGDFLGVETPDEWTLQGLLHDLLSPLGVPVLQGAPVGHGQNNRAWVWGQVGTLAGEHLTLRAG
jgi:muramoyltetrapeptide carboxypeptidase